ncbi:hypothetical protein BOTBODRAFT_166803 [Botryobasidium botryosum FD-172 SS1]|uniref:Carrier domain-containing protein n=1 Tax=Botryobasidium botryosum (strain FD-172 SS1) TaxID=930990 RepID=A0A067M706_BOTB1|nr:hypothetical protein BOTBODRAFT_166803 [Botryobasidium botryosum FD-172 SS1]
MPALSPPLPPPTGAKHGVNSETFRSPPLDGSISVPQILDYHLAHSPSHPLFRYKPHDAASIATGYKQILWRDVVRAVHRAARFVTRKVEESPVQAASPLIAILANPDFPTYFALQYGIIRAGYTAFPISPRNSPEAVAHLLHQTGSTHLVVGNEQALRELAQSALGLVARQHQRASAIVDIPIPAFGDLYIENDVDFEPLPPMVTPDFTQTALILHSSGSTSFPKPIPLTHRIQLQWCRNVAYGEMDLSREVMSLHSLPLFHAYAGMTSSDAITAGITLGVLAPSASLRTPSPEDILEEAVATGCTLIANVPSNIEVWASDPVSVAHLTKFERVMFGGAPMNPEIGDTLVASGVRLQNLYGATEIGSACMIIPAEAPGDEWNYITLSPAQTPYFQPQEDRTFELFLYPSELISILLVNTEVDGRPAYATNDIVLRHPTKPQKFKVVRRADDQIMLSTGEKTNPGPIEATIQKHPMVKKAVVFGRGKMQNGVLIEPTSGNGIDPTDVEALSSFRNAIWESVEGANTVAPSHSRIFKEMILVTSPSKPMAYTDKGSLKKQISINLYSAEIEALYVAVEDSSQTDIEPPASWAYTDTLIFVRKVVNKVLGHVLQDDDDIFQSGGDSLQATWIRNTVLRALRESGVSMMKLPQSFIYSAPTISKLTKYISSLSASGPSVVVAPDYVEARAKEMIAMVDKYTVNFPAHTPTAPAPTSEVALLTGSTGAIGSAILAHLVTLPSVSRIYAFNRKSKNGPSIRQRQLRSLEDRGLDVSIIDLPKVMFVEGDTAVPGLGLSKELYFEIRDSVTFIIHNAWRLDFNLTLSSFEPLIHGVRNLADLALASPHPAPPRVLFESSVSVLTTALTDWSLPGSVPERALEDPRIAISMGYGESKWVSERILQIASERTALRGVVIRIGQLCGGSNGSWNQSEWIPSIIRSGEVLGALPQAEGDVSWLPASVAAVAIVEMRNSPYTTLHLAHPRRTPWSLIFEYAAKSIGAELISFPEWFARLEASLQSDEPQVELVKRNPALLLLDTFRSLSRKPDVPGPGREALSMPVLDTDRAVEVAPSLSEKNLAALSTKDIDRWLRYWRKSEFLCVK